MTITLSRSEGLDILALLEDAAAIAARSRVFAFVVSAQSAIELLVGRLFPDLPEGDV